MVIPPTLEEPPPDFFAGLPTTEAGCLSLLRECRRCLCIFETYGDDEAFDKILHGVYHVRYRLLKVSNCEDVDSLTYIESYELRFPHLKYKVESEIASDVDAVPVDLNSNAVTVTDCNEVNNIEFSTDSLDSCDSALSFFADGDSFDEVLADVLEDGLQNILDQQNSKQPGVRDLPPVESATTNSAVRLSRNPPPKESVTFEASGSGLIKDSAQVSARPTVRETPKDACVGHSTAKPCVHRRSSFNRFSYTSTQATYYSDVLQSVSCNDSNGDIYYPVSSSCNGRVNLVLMSLLDTDGRFVPPDKPYRAEVLSWLKGKF